MVHYISKQTCSETGFTALTISGCRLKVCVAFIQNQDRKSQTDNRVHRWHWDTSGFRGSNIGESFEKSCIHVLSICHSVIGIIYRDKRFQQTHLQSKRPCRNWNNALGSSCSTPTILGTSWGTCCKRTWPVFVASMSSNSCKCNTRC
jgi:hypothetical protein